MATVITPVRVENPVGVENPIGVENPVGKQKQIGEPNPRFSRLATDQEIEKTVRGLESRGMEVFVAENGAGAKAHVLSLIPQGAQVYTTSSLTLDTLGLSHELNETGRYHSIRKIAFSMDRKTEGHEIRRLTSSHDYAVGSVDAITQDGEVLVASRGGSQLATYAAGAGKVIWVVGVQKIVKDLAEGFARLKEYSLPLENARAQKAYGINSAIGKVVLVNHEFIAGRITFVLVKENLGF